MNNLSEILWSLNEMDNVKFHYAYDIMGMNGDGFSILFKKFSGLLDFCEITFSYDTGACIKMPVRVEEIKDFLTHAYVQCQYSTHNNRPFIQRHGKKNLSIYLEQATALLKKQDSQYDVRQKEPSQHLYPKYCHEGGGIFTYVPKSNLGATLELHVPASRTMREDESFGMVEITMVIKETPQVKKTQGDIHAPGNSWALRAFPTKENIDILVPYVDVVHYPLLECMGLNHVEPVSQAQQAHQVWLECNRLPAYRKFRLEGALATKDDDMHAVSHKKPKV